MPDTINVGGGGVFVPTLLSVGSTIPESSVGEILRLEPPLGKRVKINMVMANGNGNSGISVLINGSKIIDGRTLRGEGTVPEVGTFCIGVQGVSSSSGPSNVSGAHPSIILGVDEVLTIEASSPTSEKTYYNYEYGELK